MLYPRHHLDIAASDLAFATAACAERSDSAQPAADLEQSLGAEILIAFSVRSAWDLFLTALGLPEGSEVVMSAVTIPDMARIAEAHGLVPVPIDLEPETLEPRLDLFRKALGPKTRLVLLSHLLGGRFDIAPFAEAAGAHGVPLVEDSAQAFQGPGTWGSRSAVVSLFSFGPIKTATALGAAVAAVRNQELLARMRALQAGWPAQSDMRFARKVAKYAALQPFHSAVVYGMLASAVNRSGGGLDAFINGRVKNFPMGGTEPLLRALRQRPSAAQVKLLRRRLESFDHARLTARAARGELLRNALGTYGLVLGGHQPARTHWLFGVAVRDPQALIRRLHHCGFDATQGATTLVALRGPAYRPDMDPRDMRNVLAHTVFLPAYPEMPLSEAIRMIGAVSAELGGRRPEVQRDQARVKSSLGV